jgi:hypothetical protein
VEPGLARPGIIARGTTTEKSSATAMASKPVTTFEHSRLDIREAACIAS